MNKRYQIEAKLTKDKWHLVCSTTRHTDALYYIKNGAEEWDRYLLRIVRVERKVVFESK